MADSNWVDWLVLILVAIIVLMIVFFSTLLAMFPPTMSVGTSILCLVAVIVILIITIIALLANGADPLAPFRDVAKTITDTASGMVSDTLDNVVKNLWPYLLLGAGGLLLVLWLTKDSPRSPIIYARRHGRDNNNEERERDEANRDLGKRIVQQKLWDERRQKLQSQPFPESFKTLSPHTEIGSANILGAQVIKGKDNVGGGYE